MNNHGPRSNRLVCELLHAIKRLFLIGLVPNPQKLDILNMGVKDSENDEALLDWQTDRSELFTWKVAETVRAFGMAERLVNLESTR